MFRVILLRGEAPQKQDTEAAIGISDVGTKRRLEKFNYFFSLAKYNWNDNIKKDEIGWVCDEHKGEKMNAHRIIVEKL